MLDKYIKMFSKLRTDRNRNLYPSFTGYRAPHKPFLLLSVMDLIDQGRITENFIEPSYELAEIWNGYYSQIMPPRSPTSMAYPFSRLHSDGFWHRLPREGYDPGIEYNIGSMKRLREIYLGARLDDELFLYLCDPETRESLRLVIIQTYFSPEVQPAILEQGRVNLEAYKYSEEILKQTNEHANEWKEPEGQEETRVRNQGFRRAIVNLYDHRCALCGIRMLTPEGHTVVEAAHIVPWNESHNVLPTNGMALCWLCHWSFDEGMMSVNREYKVLISRSVQVENNLPGHVMTLKDRPIFTPLQELYKPAQENFEYHRSNTFRQ